MSYHYKYRKYKHKYTNLKKKFDKFNSQKYPVGRVINPISMEDSIETIINSPDKSFFFYNIGLTDEEKNIISAPEFDPNDIVKLTLDYVGMNNYNMLSEQMADFLSQFYPKDYVRVSKIIIDKIVKPYVEATNKESLWFHMRFMDVTPSYDIPRWHQDGMFVPIEFYPDQKNIGTRLIGTLFGQSTLFKTYNKDMIDDYLENQKKLSHDQQTSEQEKFFTIVNNYRKITDEALQKYPTVQPKNDEVVMMVTYPENKAAIHSEPKVRRPRVFFSIVTEDQSLIKQFAEMTDQKFYSDQF